MKARKKIEPLRYRPPLGDIRNVARGKEQLAAMIAESERKDEAAAEAAGYDCGINGANALNCHVSMFASPQLTQAWDRGKKRADAERGKS